MGQAANFFKAPNKKFFPAFGYVPHHISSPLHLLF